MGARRHATLAALSREVIAGVGQYMVNAHRADALVCDFNFATRSPGRAVAPCALEYPSPSPVARWSGPPFRGVEHRLDTIDAMVMAVDSVSDAARPG